jgi:hypothetical protein
MNYIRYFVSQTLLFCESFDLPILLYYAMVLTNYVLISREKFGIMSIKVGEFYDKNSSSRR